MVQSGQNLPNSSFLQKILIHSMRLKLFCKLDCFWNSSLSWNSSLTNSSSSPNSSLPKFCYFPKIFLKSCYLANFASEVRRMYINKTSLHFLNLKPKKEIEKTINVLTLDQQASFCTTWKLQPIKYIPYFGPWLRMMMVGSPILFFINYCPYLRKQLHAY